MKLILPILLILFIFFGCSSDISSTTDNSSGNEGCTTDVYGQYGTCVSFNNEGIVGTWTVWDGNVTDLSSNDANMTLSINFRSNGTAVYTCQEDNCNLSNGDTYMWRYYNVTNEYNLTILNRLNGTLYESYEYYFDNTSGGKIFLQNSKNIKTFIKL